MRQFLLTKGTYASGNDMSAIADGAVGFYSLVNGQPTLDSDGSKVKKGEAMIVVGRPKEKGGNIVIPFYNKNFSWNKMTHQAATKFNASITIPTITDLGDYTIVIAKKGVQFNERNKWTSTVNVKSTATTASQVAEELGKRIKYFASTLGIEASVSESTITIKGLNDGDDFAVFGAENMFNVQAVYATRGSKGIADANYIADLADKACADAGIEYTYRPEYIYMYPGYPLNPLAGDPSSDPGYVVYTIRFAEPRKTKTTDEVVNQIVQIAMPSDATAVTDIEAVLAGIEA